MSFLVLKGIQKRFPGGTVAVEDFNLAAEKGEFVSFLGPSGCGKTTTLRMIAGFETPTAGTITIGGTDITYRPANRRNVGMVFQSYALFPNMSVADNIGFGLRVRRRPKDQIRKRVQELLGLINLPDKGDRYPYQLSGGQQQRVALARALAPRPAQLYADEPTGNLDAPNPGHYAHQMFDLVAETGAALVLVTHDEALAARADRAVRLRDGRVAQEGRKPA
jgi:putative spermidine/putrescine transport system ATP-binding protein